MKYECELIADLLPLYVDNVLSDASRNIVDEHISECHDCKDLLHSLQKEKSNTMSEAVQIQEYTESYGKKIKKKRRAILLSVAMVFLIAIVVTAKISITFLSGLYDYLAVDITNSVEAQEYVDQGWIPDCLPTDADNISVVYLLDESRVNGQFHASEFDINKMKENLQSATVEDLKNAKEAIKGMYNDVKTTLEKAPAGVSFYQDDDFILSISTSGTVYFYGK